MTTFLSALALVLAAMVWFAAILASIIRSVTEWSDKERRGRAVAFAVGAVALFAGGIALAVAVTTDERVCVKSDTVLIGGVPYQVCEEYATPATRNTR